jgi:hypothetical protein
MSPCRANQREFWANGAAAVTSYLSLSSVWKVDFHWALLESCLITQTQKTLTG